MRIVLLAVMTCSVGWGGVLHLKDGERLEGDVKRATTGWEITAADGKVRIIPEDQVVSIEASDTSPADPRGAAERLASLRRSVEALSDIDSIIKRYEPAIKELGKTPAAQDAKKDLAKWQQYQKDGMVKVGGRWLAPTEISALEESNVAVVEEAKALVTQNRLKDASVLVEKVLQAAPTNASALYLKGVIAFRQNQTPLARKAFEQVVASVPDHGPSLNNLAVAQWQQNASGIAMTNFQKAMTAMPVSVVIHDNVAEVLNSLGADARETPPMRKLQAQFQQDEPRLQAVMQAAGRYRWGATWVSAAELQQLRDEQAKIQTQLDDISRDFDLTQGDIDAIDDRIAVNNQTMSRLEALSWARDDQGRSVRVPYPQDWHDARRDNDAMDLRRKRELARLDTLRRQAQDVKSRLAIPPYSGKQQILDEQFIPVKFKK